MTSGVGAVPSQHSFADGWDGSTSWAVGGFGGALVVSLVAVAIVLGGWTVALSQAYAAPSGSIGSASVTRPTRPQTVHAAVSDIGRPAPAHEAGGEHRLFPAGTAVSYVPIDEAVGAEQLLSRWVRDGTRAARAE